MSIKVSLAEPAARWVDDQVASGRYKDADAYLVELVERDREEAGRHAALKAAIDEGLASGESEMTVDQIFDEAMARHARG